MSKVVKYHQCLHGGNRTECGHPKLQACYRCFRGCLKMIVVVVVVVVIILGWISVVLL